MRIVRIEISRFMGLRDVILDVSKDLQLIAGPNNAGKTTLFRAVEFFFNPAHAKDVRLRPQNEYYAREGTRALTRVRIHFGDLSPGEVALFRTAIPRGSRQFWSEIRSSRTGTVTFEASRGQPGEDIHSLVIARFNLVHVPAVRIDSTQSGATDAERLAATVRDVLIRSRPGPRSAAQETFDRRAKALTRQLATVLESSKGPISEMVLPGVDLEFRIPEAPALLDAALGRLELRPRRGMEIELRDEGTGVQSLLSLGILHYVASRNKNATNLFLIEEPEAFLHPQLQRSVAEHLKALSTQAQLLVTTHSPIIVDSVDLRKVCRLPLDRDGLTYEWAPPTLNDLEVGHLSRYCDAKNSELIFAKKVVFCEGLSDSGAIEALSGVELRGGYVSVVSMGGADNADHFVRLARHFKIPFLVVLDKDRVTGDRGTLRKISAAAGLTLVPADNDALDHLSRHRCDNPQQAQGWRDRAQVLLAPRGIFCLGNDIEGAVAFSYSKTRLIACLGPTGMKHLSAEAAQELGGLAGRTLRRRLREYLGSKGWNNEPVAEARKLKPHVPRAVVSALGTPRAGSDLLALRFELNRFASA